MGFWIFGLLAFEAMEGDTRKFDDRILIALRQPGNLAVPIGPPWTLQVARDLTAFGSAVGIGLDHGRGGRLPGLAATIRVARVRARVRLTGTLLSLVLKDLINRPRPQVVPHLTDISSASFPSGHSMMSSIVYLTMAALLARTVPDKKTKLYLFRVAVGLTSV